MKLLQNRLFVGLLAVVAVAIVIKTLWPVLHRPSSRPRQSVTVVPVPPATAVAPVPGPAAIGEKPAATPAVQPRTADLSAAEAGSRRWTTSPQLDPFQIHRVGTTNLDYPPAMQLLKLNAVWVQTGGALATINDRVLIEGDAILKFKIEKIEADSVWVQGPNGREQVWFVRPVPARTNAETTTLQMPDFNVKKAFP